MSLMNEWERVSHFLSFNDAGLPPVGSDDRFVQAKGLEEGEGRGKQSDQVSEMQWHTTRGVERVK